MTFDSFTEKLHHEMLKKLELLEPVQLQSTITGLRQMLAKAEELLSAKLRTLISETETAASSWTLYVNPGSSRPDAKAWAKRVTGLDTRQEGLYAVLGDFLEPAGKAMSTRFEGKWPAGTFILMGGGYKGTAKKVKSSTVLAVVDTESQLLVRTSTGQNYTGSGLRAVAQPPLAPLRWQSTTPDIIKALQDAGVPDKGG